ncbi:AIPR family protein [Bacteroidota bacterium]
MGIFKVLEKNIQKSAEFFSEYLSDISGDALKGAEFIFYALSNIFSDKENDEIEVGIVDSSYRGETYDFGIDAIYISASSDFIEQLEQIDDYNEDTKFKIQIFQFKRGTGISQADLLKFTNGIKKVLIDENIDDTDNLYFYNRMIVLNEIKNSLFAKFSSDNISINCNIVFGGLESNITSEKILTDELKKIKTNLESSGYTNCKIVITDCQSLINAPSKYEQIVDIIEYQKTFKYITETDSKEKLIGYISIIKGKDIAELVRKHQTSIFEANIRDYYKHSDLNSKIIETCSSEDEAKYFWSYNNGLTMTCNKVEEMPNNKYKLYNLQIVNGCQTSNAIYNAVKNYDRINVLNKKIKDGSALSKKEKEELDNKKSSQFNDDTSLLVKIIESNNDDFIYRITETTNSQTPIKAFSLKANDDIQKLIEKYLLDMNIYYERRINYWRNKGKKNVYSIQKLFQLYTSQILFKPSQVKTNPKSMFVATYDKVFPAPKITSMNYILYLIPIKIDLALNKILKEYQKKNSFKDKYQATLAAYGKLHLGCFLLSSILKGNYREKGIVTQEAEIIKQLETHIDEHFKDALKNFEKIMKSYIGNQKDAIPSAVKKAELDSKIVKYIKSRK